MGSEMCIRDSSDSMRIRYCACQTGALDGKGKVAKSVESFVDSLWSGNYSNYVYAYPIESLERKPRVWKNCVCGNWYWHPYSIYIDFQ